MFHPYYSPSDAPRDVFETVASITYPPGSVPSIVECAMSGLWSVVRNRVVDLLEAGQLHTMTAEDPTFRDSATGQTVLHFAAARGKKFWRCLFVVVVMVVLVMTIWMIG